MPQKHEDTKQHEAGNVNCLHLCAPSCLCAFVAFSGTLKSGTCLRGFSQAPAGGV